MASSMARSDMQFSAGAEQALLGYTWPGNAREMENVVQRAVILASSDTIAPEHLHLPNVSGTATIAMKNDVEVAENPANGLKSLEKAHIMNTLAAVNGSRKLAAQKLGMSERTLRHKLQHYREGV
jgi:two-component system response regulator FlrC